MFEISELKGKKLPELQEIAKGLNVPKYKSLKKLDLVYQILEDDLGYLWFANGPEGLCRLRQRKPRNPIQKTGGRKKAVKTMTGDPKETTKKVEDHTSSRPNKDSNTRKGKARSLKAAILTKT